jgi:2-C-methyl-D-erythritol 4-phosphate cytidylyltransferase
MEKMSAIVVAAGSGERFGGGENKIFAKVNDQPLFLLALQLFVNREDVCQTILVVSPADADQMKSKYGANLGFMGVKLVTGGQQRHDSVARGLEAVDEAAGYVAIHDAARVCVAADWIDQTFAAAVKHGAAVPVCPVTSTLKRVSDGVLTETVDRAGLFLSQTPQIFRRDIITSAYQALAGGGASLPDGAAATDDAQVVAAAGHEVHAVDGDARNIKITTRGDLSVASVLIRCLPQKAVARRGAFEEAQW